MGDPLSNQSAPGPPPTAVAMPRRLGRYELISQLAKGGMGQVYLARTRGVGGFERLVVVKCALPSLTEQTQQMLLAEARLAATLQHTNIVQVHDVDTDGGTVFLAMEFLHGQDARYILRRSHPLPLESALAIGLAVCAGLHYAHERRDAEGQPLEIVHRDISPSNVFVTYDGGVKLIDFGIAKATALPSETQLGSVKGKPGYMSPEQCRCEPLDRRSDVFCVGIMMYELTVGRRPFRADNEYLLHKQIIEDEAPPPSSIDPSYPRALEAIVMRALAKDRRARPPTALALQEALAEFAATERLDVSQFALGRYMAKLFTEELAAWQDAVRSGQSLVEHVIKRTTSTVRILDAPVPPDPAVGTVERAVTPTPARRSKWPLLLGIATLASAAAVAIAMFATSPPSAAVSGPATGTSPSAGASPTGSSMTGSTGGTTASGTGSASTTGSSTGGTTGSSTGGTTASGTGSASTTGSSTGASTDSSRTGPPGGSSSTTGSSSASTGSSPTGLSSSGTAGASPSVATNPSPTSASTGSPGAAPASTSHASGHGTSGSRGSSPSNASHGSSTHRTVHPPPKAAEPTPPAAEARGPDDIL